MTTYCEARPLAKPDDERTQTGLYGYPVSHSVAPKLFDIIFPSLGLPRFKYSLRDCSDVADPQSTWRTDVQKPESLGSCVTMPLKIAVMPYVDEITEQAKLVGSVNTTYFRAKKDGGSTHVGTNLDVAGVGNSLLSALSGQSTPFAAGTPLQFRPGKVAGLMIGGGGATRAAILAMSKMNVSPILLVNRDAAETAATVSHFKQFDLLPLRDGEHAAQVVQELEKNGVKVCVGVGAIPSIAPESHAEKLVYAIADKVFKHPYQAPGHDDKETDYLNLPETPCFLEMAYKPPMTIMRGVAEQSGWQTICGVEVVLEGCFEQAYLWTGASPDKETRDKGRAFLRGLMQ